MPLTEIEKQKIIEEETFRSSIQKPITTPIRKKSSCGGWLLIAFLIFILFAFLGAVITQDKDGLHTQETNNRPKDLHGEVSFKGGIFTIYNQSEKDWTHCTPVLNSDYRISFANTVINIKSGESYPIYSEEFTLENGTRFNSYTTKPQLLYLDCNEGIGLWNWD